MFRANSPYSAFFTSGLLSQQTTPERRGSLPSSRSPTAHYVDALYSTLDEPHFRSFLSLDLAESQSMRSASIKRSKASSSSRSKQPFRFPAISETPAPTPLRFRFSRDSLRTIPSPKPAPSITLPDLPTKQHHSSPPRLPPIPLIPAIDLTLPLSHSSSQPRTAVPHLPKGTSAWSDYSSKVNRFSVITTSTVSTRTRRNNRSYALARLEGRHARPLMKDFMSMSDDEDDAAGDADEENSDDESDIDSDDHDDLESFDFNLLNFNPIMEPEDCVLPFPLPSPSFLEAPRSAPLPPTKPFSPLISPAHHGGGPIKRQRTTPNIRKSSSRKHSNKDAPATSEWFPLKSFMDLRDYDSHSSASAYVRTKTTSTTTSGKWSTWMSFIEVANVS